MKRKIELIKLRINSLINLITLPFKTIKELKTKQHKLKRESLKK